MNLDEMRCVEEPVMRKCLGKFLDNF
jgi:hypothetical protein